VKKAQDDAAAAAAAAGLKAHHCGFFPHLYVPQRRAKLT
jgi:hypothetical protein